MPSIKTHGSDDPLNSLQTTYAYSPEKEKYAQFLVKDPSTGEYSALTPQEAKRRILAGEVREVYGSKEDIKMFLGNEVVAWRQNPQHTRIRNPELLVQVTKNAPPEIKEMFKQRFMSTQTVIPAKKQVQETEKTYTGEVLAVTPVETKKGKIPKEKQVTRIYAQTDAGKYEDIGIGQLQKSEQKPTADDVAMAVASQTSTRALEERALHGDKIAKKALEIKEQKAQEQKMREMVLKGGAIEVSSGVARKIGLISEEDYKKSKEATFIVPTEAVSDAIALQKMYEKDFKSQPKMFKKKVAPIDFYINKYNSSPYLDRVAFNSLRADLRPYLNPKNMAIPANKTYKTTSPTSNINNIRKDRLKNFFEQAHESEIERKKQFDKFYDNLTTKEKIGLHAHTFMSGKSLKYLWSYLPDGKKPSDIVKLKTREASVTPKMQYVFNDMLGALTKSPPGILGTYFLGSAGLGFATSKLGATALGTRIAGSRLGSMAISGAGIGLGGLYGYSVGSKSYKAIKKGDYEEAGAILTEAGLQTFAMIKGFRYGSKLAKPSTGKVGKKPEKVDLEVQEARAKFLRKKLESVTRESGKVKYETTGRIGEVELKTNQGWIRGKIVGKTTTSNGMKTTEYEIQIPKQKVGNIKIKSQTIAMRSQDVTKMLLEARTMSVKTKTGSDVIFKFKKTSTTRLDDQYTLLNNKIRSGQLRRTSNIESSWKTSMNKLKDAGGIPDEISGMKTKGSKLYIKSGKSDSTFALEKQGSIFNKPKKITTKNVYNEIHMYNKNLAIGEGKMAKTISLSGTKTTPKTTAFKYSYKEAEIKPSLLNKMKGNLESIFRPSTKKPSTQTKTPSVNTITKTKLNLLNQRMNALRQLSNAKLTGSVNTGNVGRIVPSLALPTISSLASSNAVEKQVSEYSKRANKVLRQVAPSSVQASKTTSPTAVLKQPKVRKKNKEESRSRVIVRPDAIIRKQEKLIANTQIAQNVYMQRYAEMTKQTQKTVQLQEIGTLAIQALAQQEKQLTQLTQKPLVNMPRPPHIPIPEPIVIPRPSRIVIPFPNLNAYLSSSSNNLKTYEKTIKHQMAKSEDLLK